MKDFMTKDHGKKEVNLRHLRNVIGEFMPAELHHKADGDVNDEPSFTLVFKGTAGYHIYGQISLRMLSEGLEELGYKLEKI